MDIFFRLKKYLNYLPGAKTKYYLHSPFVYQFYLNVLEGKDDEQLTAINDLRNKLNNDNTLLEVKDPGTGNSESRKISDIERKVCIRPKYGKLLYRLMQYFKPEQVLELGTSIGLSSAYMASGNGNSHITSIEGSGTIADIARKNHAFLKITNVQVETGEFETKLPEVLKHFPNLDLVFFDGNHRKEATLNYFQQCLAKSSENSIFIFDDIYWSEEMSEAWEEIKRHPQITLTIDVYQFGICFFRKDKLAKEDFVLWY